MSLKSSISSLFSKGQKPEETPKISSSPGADKPIEVLLTQPDGKILVGGKFMTLRGQTRVGIGRLNSDGTLDNEFSSDIDGSVRLISLQRDGKLLLGEFPQKESAKISRLNYDGTRDPQFSSPGLIFEFRSIAIRNDGSILIAGTTWQWIGPEGSITLVNTPLLSNLSHLVILNADGTLEDSYRMRKQGVWIYEPDHDLVPVANMVGIKPINAIAVQADGKILLGGCFASLGNQKRKNFGRLNSDGSVDTDFEANANDYVGVICLQNDGKILVGGTFTKLQGQKCKHICRLHPDGKPDHSFYGEISELVHAISVQSDGKILVQTQVGLMRLHSNGVADESFKQPKFKGGHLNAFSIQQDGKIVIGGTFTKVNDLKCERIARLNYDGTVDTSFV